MSSAFMLCCMLQVDRRILYVNVTATLGVEMAPGATPDEVEAALDLTSLSADDPIGLLSNDPDKFFGRTTKVTYASLSVSDPTENPGRTIEAPMWCRCLKLALQAKHVQQKYGTLLLHQGQTHQAVPNAPQLLNACYAC